ncbi:hypothetical protein [Pseudomonas sp. NA-150]|uniref:hypothetical protein n=1 Tax=Pseudomonas sp. NA-150 TaxID=3367525 RepID=UPI0037C9B424
MNISTMPAISRNPGVFVLRDFSIPVIDNSGAPKVGLGYRDLLPDPALRVVLLAAFDRTFSIGNLVELFWDGRRVQDFPLDQNHYDNRLISFRVNPADIIRPGQLEYTSTVYYSITDQLSGTSDRSNDQSVLIKLTVPGDPDPDSSTPWNDNLRVAYVVPPLIQPPVVNLTLTIDPWLNMSEGDVLTLYWGGYMYAVSNPPLPAPPVGGNYPPQTITVPATLIEQAKDRENLRVEYFIRDKVANWSMYSEAALTNVRIDPNAPDAPIFNDADANEIIDLALLNGKTVDVQVSAYPGIEVGDEITLLWEGKTAEGGDVTNPILPPKPVIRTNIGPLFNVPNQAAADIPGGVASAWYVVDPIDGSANRTSRPATAFIKGDALRLTEPVLDEAQGDRVDPDDVNTDAHVTIEPYSGKGFGDVVHLKWEGLFADGFTPLTYYARYDVGLNEETVPTSFLVPKSNLSPLINGTLTLSYYVVFRSQDTKDSRPVTYQVRNANSALLPKPTMDNAPGDVLDPDQFDRTVVHVNGLAAALRTNDIVNTHWIGTPGTGSDNRAFLVLTNNQNIDWPINPPLVESNRNRDVVARYEVERIVGGPIERSEVRTVSIKAPVDLNFPKPRVIEALNDILNPMDGEQGVTLLVKYDGMLTSDVIGISWDGKTYPEQNGSASGEVTFNILSADVGASIGRIISALYAVVRPGGPYLSEELELQVQMIPQAALEGPKITQAPDDILDVSALTADANLSVRPWPFIGAGQRIWLRFEGTKADGSAHNWLHPTWQDLELVSHANHHGGPESAQAAQGWLGVAADF